MPSAPFPLRGQRCAAQQAFRDASELLEKSSEGSEGSELLFQRRDMTCGSLPVSLFSRKDGISYDFLGFWRFTAQVARGTSHILANSQEGCFTSRTFLKTNNGSWKTSKSSGEQSERCTRKGLRVSKKPYSTYRTLIGAHSWYLLSRPYWPSSLLIDVVEFYSSLGLLGG